MPLSAALESLGLILVRWRRCWPIEPTVRPRQSDGQGLVNRAAGIGRLVEADLALGAHGGLIAELRKLIVAHPLRERPRGQLMRALAALGRPAEALTEFEDARHTLAEQLGVDPSAELAAVHLRGAARCRRRVCRTGAAGVELTTFVGREEELDAHR